jgi:hypothetical protein
MCDKNGWSIQSIHSNVKRHLWFTPNYWESFKHGFSSPNLVTIQHLREINTNLYPGFKNMFCAGVGYTLGGKDALTYSGLGWYLSKVPLIGPMTINRGNNELKSSVAYQLGGVTSSVIVKYLAMNYLGVLTRAALQSKHPAACATIVSAVTVTNYLNTAGGAVNVVNEYNSIREQRIVKGFVKSCESYGKVELDRILENAAAGFSEAAPGEF